MTDRQKILLVTEYPQEAAGGGAVILRSLLQHCEDIQVIWASTSSSPEEDSPDRRSLVQGSSGKGKHSPWADCLLYRAKLAHEIIKLAKETESAAVWFVLHGSICSIAAEFAKRSNLPIHATVHDEPVYATALRSRRLRSFLPIIARDLRFTLTRVKSLDVISRGMQEYYEHKYGIVGKVIHRALFDPVLPSDVHDEIGLDEIRIGVLGNTYAYSSLRALAKAMSLVRSRLHRRCTLVVCGHSFEAELRKEFSEELEIESTGHVSESEGIERLQTCLAVYLNYPFGWMNRVLSETSFPTKLSTYVYSARPLLLHSPANSTLKTITGELPFVNQWTDMNIESGAAVISQMAQRIEKNMRFHDQCEVLRLKFFDGKCHVESMRELLKALTI